MSIYQKTNSKYWWFRFTFKKKRIQRSTKVENKREAQDIARAAWVALARGEVGLVEKPKKERVSIGVLLDRLEQYYRSESKWSPQNESTLAQTREAFGKKMADELTEAHVETYIEKRIAAKRKNATINRVTEVLRRAYKLAKLPSPEIRHLSEAGNERRGFFTVQELESLVTKLPANLRDFTRFAFATGWRKSECASLKWNDIEDNVIRLRPEHSKNREPRQITIEGEIKEIIERRRQARVIKKGEDIILAEHVFHRKGQQVREFRKSWAKACEKSGVHKLFHDLRRSAVRDMIRSGVPQNVAMKISGHKTASMFRRYDIASDQDLNAAMLSVQKYREAERQKIVQLKAGR
jgi:integrase